MTSTHNIEDSQTIVRAVNLKKHFPIKTNVLFKKNTVKAVNDVTFSIKKGETYGLVGESGSGKSTVGRMIVRALEPTSGEVWFKNKNITQERSNDYKKDLQMIFQDPYSALNPRMRIREALIEPMNIHQLWDKHDRKHQVANLMEKVGLSSQYADRLPHEFSGGQRQRIVIARALALNPQFIVCDEPVSALDVSVQAQIINLFQELQEEFKLSYLFISHDLSVVKYLCDRVGVMYLGQLIEEASAEQLFNNPMHPYTKALITSIPSHNPAAKRERIVLEGDIPSPIQLPQGCFFHPRCAYATDVCRKKEPTKTEVGGGHWVKCHLYDESSGVEINHGLPVISSPVK